MNFLAHFVLATRFLEPPAERPAYVLGNALPDLLPRSDPRARFRPAALELSSPKDAQAAALRGGVLAHLATDAAFHKTDPFTEAQAGIKLLLRGAHFPNMRLRPFFLAHVLAELALDAALLRAEPTLADAFYADFAAADFVRATQWTEATLHTPHPTLPGVLARFARSRYLDSYRKDEGVAEGLSRLCARARQDTFEGANFRRLTAMVADSVRLLHVAAPALLADTAAALGQPPMTSK